MYQRKKKNFLVKFFKQIEKTAPVIFRRMKRKITRFFRVVRKNIFLPARNLISRKFDTLKNPILLTRIAMFVVVLFMIGGFSYRVFATPPTSAYTPGETLDPNCAPSATNCTVAANGSVGGSGTSGYLPRWIGATSLGNSVIYDDGTNVGIGTTTPGYKLHVSGDTRIEVASGKHMTFSLAGGNSGITAMLSGNPGDVIGISSYNTYFNKGKIYLYGYSSIEGYVNGVTRGDFLFKNEDTGADLMYLSPTGNLGIGTTTPEYTLDVNGDSQFKNIEFKTHNTYDIGATRSPRNIYASNTIVASSSISVGSTGNVGFATRSFLKSSANGLLELMNNDSSGFSRLNFGGISGSLPALAVNGNDLQVIRADGITDANLFVTGKLGVATTSPSSKIDILPTGTFSVAGVSGITTRAHTVTLSGANPTTYSTFSADQISALTLTGTNTNQTVTNAAALHITSAPIKSTNVTLTNTHGLLISAGDVSNATNSYGLTVNAQTGATNNYSAAFLGGNVGVGTSAPEVKLDVRTNADGQIAYFIGASQHGVVYGINTTAETAYLSSTTSLTALGFGINGGYDTWHITTGKNVGIQTTSPTSNFEVAQSPAGPGTVTVSGTTVTGTNTQFLNTFKVGDQLNVNTTSGSETRTISVINTNTSLTVSSSFAGTASGISYTVSDASTLFAVRGNGNVGIGTTSPSSKLDITTTALGTTQTTTSGLALVNTTAAAAGAQQISPAIRWSAKGWKTDATAGSQVVDFRSYVLPVQGTASPTGSWFLESAINGGSYTKHLTVTSAGHVGIGVTNPQFALDIDGSIHLSNGGIIYGYNNGPVVSDYGNGNVSIGATTSAGDLYLGYPISGQNIFIGSTYQSIITEGQNWGIQTNTPSSNLEVAQSSVGDLLGQVYVNSGTLTVIQGTATQFTNTFKVGDTITLETTNGSETRTISVINSDTNMTVSSAFSAGSMNNAYGNYTLVGGTRFTVKGNGHVGIGTASPVSELHIPIAPTATKDRGTISLGSGGFAGYSTANNFGYNNGTQDGSSSAGTSLAINEASSFTGDLINAQTGGVMTMKLSADGELKVLDSLVLGGYATSLSYSGTVAILEDHNLGGTGVSIKSRGTQVAQFGTGTNPYLGIGTASPSTILEIGSSDMGSGNAGPVITLGRNTNATTGAGSIDFLRKDGTHGYVWQDNTGEMRINTTISPSDANDTSGIVIGTQSSSLSSKNLAGLFTDYSNALDTIVNAPLYNFTYKSGAFNNQQFTGIITDYTPEFGMDKDATHPAGKSLNVITGLGYTFGAIKELNAITVQYDTNKNVGIGTDNPLEKLHVSDVITSGIVARFENNTGTCDINPTTSSLTCSSDINKKKNITSLDDPSKVLTVSDYYSPEEMNLRIGLTDEKTILDKINILTPVTYNWNTESDSNKKHIGFIAQEVEKLFPDLVETDPRTGFKSLNYSGFTPYLIKGFQEQQKQIEELKLQIAGISAILTPQSSVLSMMTEFFSSVVVQVSGGVGYLKDITVETLKIGSPEKRTGITLFDEVTGEPYCISVANGAQKITSGECSVVLSSPDSNGDTGESSGLGGGGILADPILPDESGGGTDVSTSDGQNLTPTDGASSGTSSSDSSITTDNSSEPQTQTTPTPTTETIIETTSI